MDSTEKELREEQVTRLREMQKLETSLNKTLGTIGQLTMEIRDLEMNAENSIDRLRGKSRSIY